MMCGNSHSSIIPTRVFHTTNKKTVIVSKPKKQTLNENEKPVIVPKPTKRTLKENEKLIVLFRQDNRCNVCTSRLMIHPNTKHKLFDFDHIIPRSKQGPTDLINIQALCKMCHAVKTGWDMVK